MDISNTKLYDTSCPITKTVIYNGTDAVAIGEPFAYAGPNKVDRPKASTDLFVGVASRAYPAEEAGAGRQIELCVPGSRGVLVRVGETVAVGAVTTFGYKATTGAKVFQKKSSSARTTATALIGDAIVREAATVTSGTATVKADLVLAAYAAPESVS